MDQIDYAGLPEFYVSDEGQKVSAPTYEAMGTCFMVMTSAETGQTGPTRVEPGEHFTSQMAPNEQWQPLNRAAGEMFERWRASLPLDGKGVPQELITQAAYQLRPREGDPEYPIDQWWPHVLRLATQLHEKNRVGIGNPTPGRAFRPGTSKAPVMPFSSSSGVMMQPGQPPAQSTAVHQPQNPEHAARAQRRREVAPPMANTHAGKSPQTV